MKKNRLIYAVACLLCSTVLFSSCVGSFGLFNRLSAWNKTVGTKFVNELVFVALNIVPVYPIAFLVDALVLNSIEFWSGSNPVDEIGAVKIIKGEQGDYRVETLENGYSISKVGESTSMELLHDKDANSWSVVVDGVSTELLTLNNDGTADMVLPNGSVMHVTLDAQGLMAARQAAVDYPLYATR